MSTAVTKGLLNIKIQLAENEDILEEHFFNEKKETVLIGRTPMIIIP
jgi:hypothetical protein